MVWQNGQLKEKVPVLGQKVSISFFLLSPFEMLLEDTINFCGTTDTPVLDFCLQASARSLKSCVFSHFCVNDFSDSPVVWLLQKVKWSVVLSMAI